MGSTSDQRQLLLPGNDNYFCRFWSRADGLRDIGNQGAETRGLGARNDDGQAGPLDEEKADARKDTRISGIGRGNE